MEVYYETEWYAPPPELKPSLKNQAMRYPARGASVRRLDHLNLLTSDVEGLQRFMEDVLGLRSTEVIRLDSGALAGAWVTSNNKTYDVAFTRDHYGAHGRFHHATWALDSKDEVLRTADIALEHGIKIETGPHKHAVQQTFFLYVYRARRQPHRGGQRRRAADAGAGLAAGGVDGGRAQEGAGVGAQDGRELPHLRHAADRGVRRPAQLSVMMQTAISSTLMRGGTSKGAYFLADDLPADAAARDRVLLAVMGSPDPRQIDGVGGADPLTSKVAIVSRSVAAGHRRRLSVLPGVGRQGGGLDAAELRQHPRRRGALRHRARPGGRASDPETIVRIFMVNTNQTVVATVQTPGGRPRYDGDTAIDGVPGTAAPIPLSFADTAGSTCGALLPTGHAVDVVNGVRVTCIDNGMPVVVMRAERPRPHRLRDPRRARRRHRAEGAHRGDPAERRPDDEPGRRDQQHGAEDDPGVAAARRRRHLARGPSSRIAATRRSASLPR